AGLGAFALQHRGERLALRVARALVDHRLHGATALVDRARPGVEVERAEAVQADVAEMAFIDAERHHRAAITVLRQGVELAGAAVIAVAVDEMRTFDAPRGLGHRVLLVRRPRAITPEVASPAQ